MGKEYFDFDELATRPFKKYVITYSGSNDEGYIDEVTGYIEEGVALDVGDLHGELEQGAYNLLEDSWGGWEINEGSHGEITIVVEERKAYLHHGEIVESTNWHDSVHE